MHLIPAPFDYYGFEEYIKSMVSIYNYIIKQPSLPSVSEMLVMYFSPFPPPPSPLPLTWKSCLRGSAVKEEMMKWHCFFFVSVWSTKAVHRKRRKPSDPTGRRRRESFWHQHQLPDRRLWNHGEQWSVCKSCTPFQTPLTDVF